MISNRVGLISDPLSGPGVGSIPLDALGIVSGVQMSTQYPGGDLALSCNLTLDPNAIPDAMRLGRRLRAVLAGQTIWQGTYDTPDPGVPWTVSATGLASIGTNLVVATGASTNTTIDAAIAAGELPWTRAGSMPDGPQPTDQMLMSISDYLNNASLSGTKWVVSANAELAPATDPTIPTHVLIAQSVPARTTADYWTRVQAMYLNSGAGGARAFTAVTNGGAVAQHGLRTAPVDLTGYPAMSTATAQSYLQTVLNRSGYRASFTGPFVCTTGQLLSYPGGVPVDLATVRAGGMVRVINIDPDQSGETTWTGFTDLVIGETDYSVDDDTLELHPIEISREDLQQMLSDLVPQAA